MSFGDRIEIEMKDREGESIFGKIDQRIKQYYRRSERRVPRLGSARI